MLASLIDQHGWKMAVWAVVAALSISWLAVFVGMRSDPAEIGLKPYGVKTFEPIVDPLPSANPVRQAFSALSLGVQSIDFWLLAGSFFVCGASTNGLIGTHLVPACVDHGMPEVQAAGLLAMMGLFDLVATTASGWLSDRFSNRWLLFGYYALRGLSLLFLPEAFNPSTSRLTIFAVFYGLDWIATVPPTVALAAKIFGREKAGVMFGWIFASHQIGAAATAFFAGFIRSMEGSYDRAFLISGVACVLTAFGVLLIGTGKYDRAEALRFSS